MIVDTQREMICRYLPDTTLTFVNQAYCRTFGLSESALIGRKFLEHTPPDYREKLVAIISSLTPEQPAITHEHRAVLPDGYVCWQEWTDQAIFNEVDELIEYQAVGRDITERKKTEEALRVSEQELRTIADNMTDVVSMADVEGRFTYLSESIYQQTGYRPSELLGKSFLELIHEDDLSTAAAIFQESVVEGRKGAISSA